jgi:hypothetical protein
MEPQWSPVVAPWWQRLATGLELLRQRVAIGRNGFRLFSALSRAPHLPLIATGCRESEEAENDRNKRKPLPWVATSCATGLGW